MNVKTSCKSQLQVCVSSSTLTIHHAARVEMGVGSFLINQSQICPNAWSCCWSLSHLLRCSLSVSTLKSSALSWECLKGLHSKSMRNYLSRKKLLFSLNDLRQQFFTLSNSDKRTDCLSCLTSKYSKKSYFY